MGLPNLVRAGSAAAAGLLLAIVASGTATAGHPEPPPRPFTASAMGEDGCTVFETAGEARWTATHPGLEDYRIAISGHSSALATPGAPGFCLPVIPADRHVEVTALADGVAVAEHVEPIESGSSSSEYRFDFTTSAEVDRLTVAVCQERRGDGSTWPGRCGETVALDRDAGAGEPGEPQPYSHEFVLPDTCYKATVDATVQWLGSTRVLVEGVASTALAGPDHACDPVEQPPGEYRVVFTANHHDSVLEELEVPYPPAETGGEFGHLLPSDPEVVVDVHYVVAKVCAFDGEGVRSGCLQDSLQVFDPEIPEDHCAFTYAVTADWGNGFIGEIGITPLLESLHSWSVVIAFGDGRQMQSVWNARWTQSGGAVEMTNTSWNGVVPVGSTVTVGFVASGPSDPPPAVEVYGNGRPCKAA